MAEKQEAVVEKFDRQNGRVGKMAGVGCPEQGQAIGPDRTSRLAIRDAPIARAIDPASTVKRLRPRGEENGPVIRGDAAKSTRA